MAKVVILSVLLILLRLTSACKNPELVTRTYTTEDATIVSEIGYVLEFNLKCPHGESVPTNLYAELKDGNIVPVAVVGKNTFQVSWTEDKNAAKKGEIRVRIFDEDGHKAIRKAIRASEPTSSVSEFFDLPIYHSGTYTGPYVRSEFVALVIASCVAYFAFKNKSSIVS